MSKYVITVKEVLEDGTKRPFFFDEENTVRKIKANGFVIIGIDHDGKHAKETNIAIHNTNPIMIGEAMLDNMPLKAAAVKLVEAVLMNCVCDCEEDDDAAD